MEKMVPGGELNSRPTPKAFGAALRIGVALCILQVVEREMRILFRFQEAFHFPGFFQIRQFLAGGQFNFTQPFCRVGMVPAMLL